MSNYIESFKELVRDANAVAGAISAVLFAVGAAVLALSYWAEISWSPLRPVRRATGLELPLVWAGLAAMALGALILIYLIRASPRSRLKMTVQKDVHSFVVRDTGARMEICFGDIADCLDGRSKEAVVLPVNEHFDEECIHDHKSAIGAFAARRMEGGTKALALEVASRLPKEPAELHLAPDAPPQKCFGIGTIVEVPIKCALVYVIAATSKAIMQGQVYSDVCHVAHCVGEAVRKAATAKVETLIFPVIGTGYARQNRDQNLALMTFVLISMLKSGACKATTIRIVVWPRGGTDTDQAADRKSALRVIEGAALLGGA